VELSVSFACHLEELISKLGEEPFLMGSHAILQLL